MPSIHYQVDGAGPPLTLVHGVGARLESWDEVVERLAPRFRVIRLDLRGHGRSGPIENACTLEDFADDVRYVWDQLGVTKSHVAGFSLGGLIAQCTGPAWAVTDLAKQLWRLPPESWRPTSKVPASQRTWWFPADR